MTFSNPKLYTPPATEAELLLKWLRRARESQLSHYAQARKLTTYGLNLGVPVIIITAIIGTSAFSSVLTETIPIYAKVIAGLAGLSAAVLASLQTFFRFSERAEKHRVFAAKFGAVRRELEVLHIRGQINSNDLDGIRIKLDQLAEEAPDVETVALSGQDSNIHHEST